MGTILSYRIFRNQILIDEIEATEYYDDSVLPNHTYWYYVEAVNYLNEISPPSISVQITIPGALPVFQMGFEEQADFSLSIPGWTMYDLDQSSTWTWDNINFPNEGNPMSWMVFNPFQTSPPLTNITAYTGEKFIICINSVNPPNDDWLISPGINIQAGYRLSFMVKSFSGDFGLERLRFLVSNTDAVTTSFTALSTEPWLTIPTQWTQINYDLSAYTGQHIYLAWQCVSWDDLALCLDDIVITQDTPAQDNVHIPIPDFEIFPNPAGDHFSVSSKNNLPFDIRLYNIKGQQIYKQSAVKSFSYTNKLPPGVYFIRIIQKNNSIRRKIVIY
jgi:hypothetical protein